MQGLGPLGQDAFLGTLTPLSPALPWFRFQLQLPDALNQLLCSLGELFLLLYQNVLLPLWHMLLGVLARAREHCHEACR